MNAVWSFWSKPYFSDRQNCWVSDAHHWMSWVLSLETARKHYPSTHLVTDSRGAEIIVDRLGLQFSEVSVELDVLHDEDPKWWALGKIYTYSLQTAPFVHVDSDVYLWKRLPEYVEMADVFTQNPEVFSEIGHEFYRPDLVENAFQKTGAEIPVAWRWYRQSGLIQRAECCGILGGQNTNFIRNYANQAIDLALNPNNQSAWSALGDKSAYMTLVEQYMLSACTIFQNAHKPHAWSGVEMRYIFESMNQAYDKECSTRHGFTHLIADAKKHPEISANLATRVRRDYPKAFDRCAQM